MMATIADIEVESISDCNDSSFYLILVFVDLLDESQDQVGRVEMHKR